MTPSEDDQQQSASRPRGDDSAMSGPVSSPVRMFYIDDSGAEDTGWATYSWIETTPDGWRTMLRRWLTLRGELYAKFRIPPSVEMHTTKFVAGRSRPSTDARVNDSRAQRVLATEMMLEAVADLPQVAIGTAYRQTSARGRAFYGQKNDLYAQLTQHLDQRLTTAGELGLVFMDGDGTDAGYAKAHRGLKLATRSIIEDPLFQGSHLSQPVQIADLIAWTTYQHLLRHPGKRQFWDWYDRYLRPLDGSGEPLAL